MDEKKKENSKIKIQFIKKKFFTKKKKKKKKTSALFLEKRKKGKKEKKEKKKKRKKRMYFIIRKIIWIILGFTNSFSLGISRRNARLFSVEEVELLLPGLGNGLIIIIFLLLFFLSLYNHFNWTEDDQKRNQKKKNLSENGIAKTKIKTKTNGHFLHQKTEFQPYMIWNEEKEGEKKSYKSLTYFYLPSS